MSAHERSSSESTKQFASAVGFGKKSNEHPTQKVLYAGGLRLDFFSRESLQDIEKRNDPFSIAKHAFSILMMGWPKKGTWGNLTSWRSLRAILLARDPELLRHARLVFQEGFHHVYQQLKDKQFTDLEHRQIELYLSNCLSMLPFTDLNPYESITLPQYIQDQWVMVEYKVTPIELTPTEGFKRLFLQDNDRVFAYGLTPIENEKATPHLIFMGTTYPAGQGLMSQLRADMNGFRTAGEELYQQGRQDILEWIDKQNHKPHVCGMSLGGILSLLLSIDQGDKLSRVDALNPPGLHPSIFHRMRDQWDHLNPKPPVYVQKQDKDPVSRFGYWKQDWHILQVNAPVSQKGPNGYADHALNYAGFENTAFIEIDAHQDNIERRWRNRLLYTLTRGVIYYALILPYHYVIQPILRFAIAHPVLITLLLITALCIPFAPLIVTLPLLALSSALLIYHTSQAGRTLIHNLKHRPDIAACHDPALPRNAALDLYHNQTTATFSNANLHTYTSIFKNKNDREDMSILESTETSSTVKASKAKIYDMQRSVYLMNRWGLHRPKATVFEAVNKEHLAYEQGLKKSRTMR